MKTRNAFILYIWFITIFFINGLANAYENFNTGYYYADTSANVGVSCPASVKVGTPLKVGVQPMILPLGRCSSTSVGSGMVWSPLTFSKFTVVLRGFPYGAQGTPESSLKTWGPFIKITQPQVLSYPTCDHVVAVLGTQASITVINKVPAELANTAAIIRVLAIDDNGAQLSMESGCYVSVIN